MACCGGKRAAASAAVSPRVVKFEYRGKTPLTVVGSATGRVYWFAGPGARIDMHPRDAEALGDTPQLARIET